MKMGIICLKRPFADRVIENYLWRTLFMMTPLIELLCPTVSLNRSNSSAVFILFEENNKFLMPILDLVLFAWGAI